MNFLHTLTLIIFTATTTLCGMEKVPLKKAPFDSTYNRLIVGLAGIASHHQENPHTRIPVCAIAGYHGVGKTNFTGRLLQYLLACNVPATMLKLEKYTSKKQVAQAIAHAQRNGIHLILAEGTFALAPLHSGNLLTYSDARIFIHAPLKAVREWCEDHEAEKPVTIRRHPLDLKRDLDAEMNQNYNIIAPTVGLADFVVMKSYDHSFNGLIEQDQTS